MLAWWPTRLERQIAMRYLRGQRGTRSASLQTLIAIGSISLAVCAMIVVLGVMNGLRNDLRDRILVASPHLRVQAYGANLKLDHWAALMDTVRRDPDVVAVAPEVVTQSLVMNTAGFPEAVYVAGVEPGAGTNGVMHLDSAMVSGDLHFRIADSADVDGAVVLGAKLADHLGVQPGDIISMLPPTAATINRATGAPDLNPKRWALQVTGIFQTGMFIYDNQYVLMDRTTAQRFAGLDSAVSDLAVRVRDPWHVAAVAARLQRSLGDPYLTQTWQEVNSSLFSALQLEKLAMGLVIFFIMVVAAFNIVGTLTMVVAFKTREIGILEAMGLQARGVGRIFLAQGTIVGLIGTGIGLVFGLALALLVNRRIHIDPTIYFIDRLPIHVELLDVLAVVAASLAVAVLATIPSSRHASRLVPVDAIRAE